MKKLLKILLPSLLIVIAFITVYILVIGGRIGGVYVNDFTVTEDGGTMILEAGVSASAGYLRKADTEHEDGKAYITFYRTYGINNPNGAKAQFPIKLDGCTEVYIWSGRDAGFVKVLEMQNGEWIKVG